jgi:hypothetical protein
MSIAAMLMDTGQSRLLAAARHGCTMHYRRRYG